MHNKTWKKYKILVFIAITISVLASYPHIKLNLFKNSDISKIEHLSQNNVVGADIPMEIHFNTFYWNTGLSYEIINAETLERVTTPTNIQPVSRGVNTVRLKALDSPGNYVVDFKIRPQRVGDYTACILSPDFSLLPFLNPDLDQCSSIHPEIYSIPLSVED